MAGTGILTTLLSFPVVVLSVLTKVAWALEVGAVAFRQEQEDEESGRFRNLAAHEDSAREVGRNEAYMAQIARLSLVRESRNVPSLYSPLATQSSTSSIVRTAELCPTCGKSFVDNRSLQQHREATGHGLHNPGVAKKGKRKPRLSNARTLNPPFPNASGSWVPREDFTGQKSFGFFTCGSCNKDWSSAHSYKLYTQQCKVCACEAYPTQMWHNDDTAARDSIRYDDNDEEEEYKPHLRHLCGACKAGVCTKSERMGSRGY
eukprot:CAMPEP_0181368620 /NCGR_PEP_ID=MMETSP1106-20121128/12215_1 /TAXON_ID=81844 /ORGANISM="Mantoniella antarctica, Strain SL-175" /LENGTH=260 /DNA_ID=CAMNT_0023484809 /DNA_START=560 /DNA_END=1342 /DNA_ORIENTATION=+